MVSFNLISSTGCPEKNGTLLVGQKQRFNLYVFRKTLNVRNENKQFYPLIL